MIEGFEAINKEQFETCKEAIAWITILIAGSDGEIDHTETEWAEKLTKIRSYSSPMDLSDFYKEVGKDYAAVMARLLERMPSDTTERTALLTRKLNQLNDILPRLDNTTGYHLYKSYKSFAHHVAKASGGFLGFFSVSPEEKKLIDLPMINPVELYEEEDESEA